MKFHTIVKRAAGGAVQLAADGGNWKQVRDFVGSSQFYSYDPVRVMVLLGPEGKLRLTPGDWVVKETDPVTSAERVYVVKNEDFERDFELGRERDTDEEDKQERERVANLEKEANTTAAREAEAKISETAPSPPAGLSGLPPATPPNTPVTAPRFTPAPPKPVTPTGNVPGSGAPQK